jgi:hypothetical protein
MFKGENSRIGKGKNFGSRIFYVRNKVWSNERFLKIDFGLGYTGDRYRWLEGNQAINRKTAFGEIISWKNIFLNIIKTAHF